MTLDYLSHIREETERFIDAAGGNLDLQVPSCPGWDVRTLSFHVWDAFSFWRQIVERRLTSYKEAVRPEPPKEPELLRALTGEATTLVGVLEATDPETPIWTWSINKTARFVPRRMAHEISVHRWDCENAVGRPGPIEGDMAWDGVVEFFEYFFLREHGWKGDPVSVRLRRTDGAGEFEARSPGSHESPQVTVEATASDLLLTVWGRLPLDGLTAEGDASAFERLLNASDRE